MLKVGIAGLGFMGWIHWLAYQKTAGVQVAAICTPRGAPPSRGLDRHSGEYGAAR